MKIKIEKLFADKAFAIVAVLLLGCAFLSAIIPPFQSPDEPDHLERAYLLGKGVFVLEHLEGSSSGGNIDSGLLSYMASYMLDREEKLTAEDIEAASEIRWTGQRKFDPSPGTGYYFPIVYAPHAIGLVAGEWMDLTVDRSYRLARALALLTAGLLLFAAFRIYPVNPFVLALLAMPMSVFMLSSAGLDGISTALATFAIATFMRLAKDKMLAPSWTSYALALSIVVLGTSRIHALPMVLLIGASFFYTRHKRALYLFAASTLVILGWTLLALKTTVDLRVANPEPTSSIIFFYILNPFQFAMVLWNTVADQGYLYGYYRSFLGVLGWLDAAFAAEFYRYLGALLFIIAAFSISLRNVRDGWSQRVLLISISLISVLFIFFALLVTWTPHPAKQILGVQGRYFLIPAILFAYGVAGDSGLFRGLRTKIATVLCMVLFAFSITASTSLLIQRYYLTPFKIEVEKVVHYLDGPGKQVELMASLPLEEGSPIPLKMPSLDGNEYGKLRTLGVMFGTYSRQNLGKAEIILETKTGGQFRQEFSLSTLSDNSYKYFKVPADDYVSGEIRSVSGGGVSVWESHSADGRALTCLNLQTTDDWVVVVQGCP